MIFNLFQKKKTTLFTPEEEERMVEAIRSAEMQTSGEIRLFIESKCSFVDPTDRAREIFVLHEMHKTKDRNAVLIYIAVNDKQLAVFGDEGIHQKLGQSFWNESVREILHAFNKQDYLSGLCQIIQKTGDALKTHFPHQDDDVNELPDGIIFGK